MEHSKELKSVKQLLVESFGFLRLNWKKVVKFVLPIYGVIFVSTLLFYGFDFIEVENMFLLYSLVFVLFLLSVIVFVLKFSILLTPLAVRDITNHEESKSFLSWYKSSIKILPRVFGVVLLSSCLNVLAFCVLAVIAFIVFTLPVIFTVLAFKLGLTGVGTFMYNVIADNNVSIILLGLLSIFILIGSFMFFIWNSFSLYVALFEKRGGLSAIASSFLLVKGRYKKITIRLAAVSFISLIPFLVLSFPLEIKIFIDGVRAMIFQYLVLNLPPVLPTPSTIINFSRDMLGLISAGLSTVLFSVLGYFLWKDVQMTAAPFNEKSFNKTLKWLKRSLYTGAIILVLCILILVIVSLFTPAK